MCAEFFDRTLNEKTKKFYQLLFLPRYSRSSIGNLFLQKSAPYSCVVTRSFGFVCILVLGCQINQLFKRDAGEKHRFANSLARLAEWIAGHRAHSAQPGARKSRINAQGRSKEYFIN